MKQQSLQRNDIQGLRAIAVLGVIFFHVNKEWLPGGFVGVDIFFVISGFLITGIVLRQLQSNSFSLKAFYISRLKRIVPAYMALLMVVTLAAAVLLIPRDYDSYWESLKASIYFNSNNYFASQHDYFAPAAYELPLLHLWSLAVEMQYYLLLPLLLFFIPERFLKISILLIVSGLTLYSAWQISSGLHQKVYFSLLSRIPEFLIGGVFAAGDIGRRWKSSASNLAGVIGITLVASSFWLITEGSDFPGLLALPPCIGVALVIAAQNSLVNRLLSNSVLVWIGALSYSLYLWHWPVLAMLRYFGESYILSFPMLLAFSFATIVFASISYKLIEAPFRSKKSKSFALIVLMIVSASLILMSLIPLNARLVSPMDVELTRYASGYEICHGRVVGDCSRGDRSADKTIVILGDSHAAQLNLFADEVGKRLGVKFKVITGSSCVTIEGFDIEKLPEWAREPCEKQIKYAALNLDSADAYIVAGKWQYQVQSSIFLKALNKFISNADNKDKSVILLAQVPMLDKNVQRAYRLNELGFRSDVNVRSDWRSSNDKIYELSKLHKNAIFLDLSKLPLFTRPPFYEGKLIYQDDHHLNEIGSRLYGVQAASVIAGLISRSIRHD
ncbi:acyltransferase family protein [Pseudomonas sp. NPDC078700]|uniref:acyltransferase family protein n=1 Tax=Pseudomonas sp. NPDC078700 TaxID=3364424 RepID=UPI0037C84FE2